MTIRKPSRKHTTSKLGLECLENRELLAGDFMQNPVEPSDVDNDGFVTPLDAMLVINTMTDEVRGQPSANNGGPQRFLDVNNDGGVSPVDVLRVINRIDEMQRARARRRSRSRTR